MWKEDFQAAAAAVQGSRRVVAGATEGQTQFLLLSSLVLLMGIKFLLANPAIVVKLLCVFLDAGTILSVPPYY